MVNSYYRQPKKVMPPKVLNGNDIMRFFELPPSKLIGQLLREVQEAQSEGTVKTKEDGLAYLKQNLERIKAGAK